MYVPEHFRLEDRAEIAALLAANAFAMLVTTGEDGVPVATHLPLMLDGHLDGGRLLGHFARPNPQGAHVDGRPALAIFAAEHAYVSPLWYPSFRETRRQVPTWNYRAVHLTGRLEPLSDPADVERMMEGFAAMFEGAGGWTPAATDPGFYARLLRGIVPFALRIERVEAKAKLGQNKSAEDQAAVNARLPELASPGPGKGA